jgi:HipA-like protein
MANILGEAFRRMLRKRRSPKHSDFRLDYKPADGSTVTVGYLSFADGWWTFTYDEEYKRQTHLRPLEGFDDLTKTYKSKTLFPFFAVRVPDEQRTDVRRRLEEEDIKHPDESDLLRMFGRRAAASPAFELLEK